MSEITIMYQDIVMQQPNPSYAQVLKEPPHRLTLPNVIDNVNLLQSSAQRAANQQRQRSSINFISDIPVKGDSP